MPTAAPAAPVCGLTAAAGAGVGEVAEHGVDARRGARDALIIRITRKLAIEETAQGVRARMTFAIG